MRLSENVCLLLSSFFGTCGFAILAMVVNAQEPDWSGQYESRSYTVIVSKTATGYDCQWLDTQGVLTWYGVLARNEVGDWIETYPPDISPRSSVPWAWEADNKGNPSRVVHGGTVWELKALK